MSAGHVIVVGTGGRAYREYALRSLAGRYRVDAVLPAAPDWQLPHLGAWRVADLTDPDAVTRAIADLAGPGSGVLTWDETALEVTAQAAERLGLRHMSARSAARCRDKYRTRVVMQEAGLPAVRFGLAHHLPEALRLAESIGYPVVVKPRALAGSVGVVRADDPAALCEAFALAAGSTFATLPTGHGVLVEELLDGPEISVDSVVADGTATPLFVGRKRLGFDPLFEEVGHLLAPWDGEPWAGAVRDLVTGVHAALGVEVGVTHAEIRLTSRGPRLVELNGRLGGDLIPFTGQLASGIDLVVAAAELALGRTPDVTPTRHRAAEVAFVYPPHDGTVTSVSVDAAAAVPGVAHAAVLAPPGTALRLPPEQAVPRLAALVAVGDDERACGEILARALPLVESTLEATAPSREPVGATP